MSLGLELNSFFLSTHNKGQFELHFFGVGGRHMIWLQIEFSWEILIYPCHWSAVIFSFKLSGKWLERLVPSVLLTISAAVLQE